MTRCIIPKTDSYKASHYKGYPRGTQLISSYCEARGGDLTDEIVFFGLQAIIKQHFTGVVVTITDAIEYSRFFERHFGDPTIYNFDGWRHIAEDHGGKLPVKIIAAPEGAVYAPHTPLFTITNTCPLCAWVTSYLEPLLVQVWYPSTVATYSREVRKTILRYLEDTGTPAEINFKLHDFGYRGSSSYESAGIGGAAHLLNFDGTDTLAGIEHINEFYTSAIPGMWGYSVPAAEHSTITAWGKDHEREAYANMLKEFSGNVAVVSDSYNIFNAAGVIWPSLREEVLGHDGKVIIRPDSGEPVDVCTTVIELLGSRFGYHLNDKNYRVLPDNLRIIQGDGTDLRIIDQILAAFKRRGWSADNIAFGMGGGLLQKHNRDDLGFTLKASVAIVDGRERPISKNPVTASWKASKAGWQDVPSGQVVFEDGEAFGFQHFGDMRDLARAGVL